MISSKDGFCDKSDAEIFEQPEKIWFRCDGDFKCEALKRLILLLCGGGRQCGSG